MTIKVLGAGCAKCNSLEAMVTQAIVELEVNASIEKVKDLNRIADYGAMMTPGLVINEQLKSAGKLPSFEQIKSWIREAN
ncbi:thioredoxin family protein [candidate division KSB1 bacterium]|nr:thioredoxin family protein [candidate division KSB1 bacterium]